LDALDLNSLCPSEVQRREDFIESAKVDGFEHLNRRLCESSTLPLSYIGG
jgi:hypothetical protein